MTTDTLCGYWRVVYPARHAFNYIYYSIIFCIMLYPGCEKGNRVLVKRWREYK